MRLRGMFESFNDQINDAADAVMIRNDEPAP